MSQILSIQQLSKRYGSIQALQSVSFEVPEGAVFGVLGPNGSGKTTLLGILLGVLQAQSGSFSWFGGIDAPEARKQIGALLETPNFYPYLPAPGNLRINAAIKGRGADDIDRVLRLVRLDHRKDAAFSSYSLGMKQRLAIANALLGRPRVLVLDEPTNGLDPEGIAEIRELILQLKTEGYTILIASHLLDEIEKVCTHVAVLRRGTLLAAGPVDEVFRQEDTLELGAADPERLRQLLRSLPGLQLRDTTGPLVQVVLPPELDPAAVNSFCFGQGIVLDRISLRKKSLESRFMEMTRE